MTDNTWVDVLVALGVSGIIGTIVNFIFNRRGLKADAAKVIAEAASTMTGTMERRMMVLEAEAEARREYDRQCEALDYAHVQWDRQVYAALKALDPDTLITPPPPTRPVFVPPVLEH